jgi:hypothetical protein
MRVLTYSYGIFPTAATAFQASPNLSYQQNRGRTNGFWPLIRKALAQAIGDRLVRRSADR